MSSADLEALAIRADVALARGFSEAAARLASNILGKCRSSEPLYAHALYVHGAARWELGDEQVGFEQLGRAASHVSMRENQALLARIRLKLLELGSDSGSPYHVSLPQSAE